MDLEDKGIVVTGGAGGIGRALIERLVERNTRVFALDRNINGLKTLKRNFPSLHTLSCDIAAPSQAYRAVRQAERALGRIDGLVNNAGLIRNAPLVSFQKRRFSSHPLGLWDRILAVNLSSVFFMTSLVAQRMLQKRVRGVVVNVGSVCAAGNAGQGAYSAAKAGVASLTVTWAKELGPCGIRVAGIAPGITHTAGAHGAMDPVSWEAWKRKTPLRRVADPVEVADGLVFILQNDFFHGRILELDGGLRL